ncbi:MAG: hypothetical protein AB7E23_04155 [Bacilli bacterium]
MKIKVIYGLIMASILMGCSANPTTSEDTILVPPETTSETVSELPPVTSEIVTSEDDLPPPPGSTDTGPVETGDITFDAAIPSGWTYITNNEAYPNPEFYSDGGLKFNYIDQALKSPVYPEAVNTLTLTGKLNKNTRLEGTPTTLTIYKIVESAEVEVDSLIFSETGLSTFSETISITGGAEQFLLKMTARDGYNINLNSIALG